MQRYHDQFAKEVSTAMHDRMTSNLRYGVYVKLSVSLKLNELGNSLANTTLLQIHEDSLAQSARDSKWVEIVRRETTQFVATLGKLGLKATFNLETLEFVVSLPSTEFKGLDQLKAFNHFVK